MNTRQMEKEEDSLEADLANGFISMAQFNNEMKELQRVYREAAEESAQEAYFREMEKW